MTRLTEAFNRMLDRLETERRESGFRALVAEETERRRVAAELHDEIGQRLTALLLQIDRLSRSAPPELGEEFASTLTATKETLEGVRGLARRLRPEVLDELGLVPALRNLCDRIEEGTGLVVRRSLDPELPQLSPDAELVVYRVAQEALTNVVRHAQAEEAHVTLAARDGEVELVVHDAGVGVRRARRRGFRRRDPGHARACPADRRPARGRAGRTAAAPTSSLHVPCRSGS